MDRSNIYIIHPVDETTDFLEEITNHLAETTKVRLTIYRVKDIQEHKAIFETINEIPETCPILFLGHGNSDSLSGARRTASDYGSLIYQDQIDCFKDRHLLLLSCRSAEYLQTFGRKAGIKAGIGFPNLVTHKEDLLYSQNYEREKQITEYEISLFRQIIVDTIMYSLEDFVNDSLSFFQLYKRIQMRVHRQLIKYYSNSVNNGNFQLGKMMNDMNDGMLFIGN